MHRWFQSVCFFLRTCPPDVISFPLGTLPCHELVVDLLSTWVSRILRVLGCPRKLGSMVSKCVMTCMDPRPTNSQLSHFPLKGMMWGTTKIGSPCQANRLHVTKSAVQAWAESLTYAWHMAVLDHRFPPEAENSWNCFEAMSVDNKRFDQEPELASQRIRQLEEKTKRREPR